MKLTGFSVITNLKTAEEFVECASMNGRIQRTVVLHDDDNAGDTWKTEKLCGLRRQVDGSKHIQGAKPNLFKIAPMKKESTDLKSRGVNERLING